MSKQYGFYFDSERCIKCWACEVACKQWHGIKAGTIKLRRVTEITTGHFPDVKRTFLSLSCMHCGKAPCIIACPEKAISKRTEDGIVVVDNAKCIGCRSCFEACPFGIPQFTEDGTMRKCDMCLDRLERGEKPICVATCPTQALRFGTMEELSRLVADQAARKLAGSAIPSMLMSIK
jgi:anaerobic dimethyl sulfoxide reductase subunit B (iron-sulfur subunit)